jgi:hypothetical protein
LDVRNIRQATFAGEDALAEWLRRQESEYGKSGGGGGGGAAA